MCYKIISVPYSIETKFQNSSYLSREIKDRLPIHLRRLLAPQHDCLEKDLNAADGLLSRICILMLGGLAEVC
jgi:hypothetical protein